jgi:hypothetical protein
VEKAGAGAIRANGDSSVNDDSRITRFRSLRIASTTSSSRGSLQQSRRS